MSGNRQLPNYTTGREGVVEYCLRNVSPEGRAALRESDLGTSEAACLGRCGDCYAGPFLVVDGEFVRGEHRPLLARFGGEP